MVYISPDHEDQELRFPFAFLEFGIMDNGQGQADSFSAASPRVSECDLDP